MITVYAFRLPAKISLAALPPAADELPIPRAKLARKFRNEIDAYRTVVGELITRAVVAKTHGKRDFTPFLRSPENRPSLPGYGAYDFNVSHSGNWVVVGYAAAGPIGIDVEEAVEIDDLVPLRVFTHAELAAFASAADRRKTFFEMWTAKESVLKMLGTGLTLAPQSFTLAPDSAGRRSANEYPWCTIETRWIDEKHALSVCGTTAAFPSEIRRIDADFIANF